MRDRPESTPAAPAPPPDLPFDPDHSLRCTYLMLLRKRDRRLLGALCRSMLELTREAPAILNDIRRDGMVTDLEAAVADLRYLAGYLKWTGASEGSILERWEARLGDVAERLAPRVVEIADEMEDALDAARQSD